MELNAYDPQVQSTSAPLRYATAIQKIETPRMDNGRMDIGPFLRYEGRSPAAPPPRPARRPHFIYGRGELALLPSASRATSRRSPIAVWMARLVRRLGQTE
jgi:hypothetical protein